MGVGLGGVDEVIVEAALLPVVVRPPADVVVAWCRAAPPTACGERGQTGRSSRGRGAAQEAGSGGRGRGRGWGVWVGAERQDREKLDASIPYQFPPVSTPWHV